MYKINGERLRDAYIVFDTDKVSLTNRDDQYFKEPAAWALLMVGDDGKFTYVASRPERLSYDGPLDIEGLKVEGIENCRSSDKVLRDYVGRSRKNLDKSGWDGLEMVLNTIPKKGTEKEKKSFFLLRDKLIKGGYMEPDHVPVSEEVLLSDYKVPKFEVEPFLKDLYQNEDSLYNKLKKSYNKTNSGEATNETIVSHINSLVNSSKENQALFVRTINYLVHKGYFTFEQLEIPLMPEESEIVEDRATKLVELVEEKDPVKIK